MMDLQPFVLHMERQLRSVSELLECVERQESALSRQDANGVVSSAFEIQAAVTRRESLDAERASLLLAAAAQLNTTPERVTLEALEASGRPEEAELLRDHSQALRQLLDEVQRRYQLNRQLIQQELNFASHMVEALGTPTRSKTYGKSGQQDSTTPVVSTSILDVKG